MSFDIPNEKPWRCWLGLHRWKYQDEYFERTGLGLHSDFQSHERICNSCGKYQVEIYNGYDGGWTWINKRS